MKEKFVFNSLESLRKYFALFAVLWIMLASCNIQASITNFHTLNSGNTEQTSKSVQPKKAETNISADDCSLKLLSENSLLLEKGTIDLSLSNSFIFLVSIFLISLGIPFEKEEKVHPLYGSSLIIDPSLPIFIKHQNLRI